VEEGSAQRDCHGEGTGSEHCSCCYVQSDHINKAQKLQLLLEPAYCVQPLRGLLDRGAFSPC